MEASQEATAQYFKAKRDQYLIEIRKSKNNDIIHAKRVKLSAALYASSYEPQQQQEDTFQDTAIEIIKPIPDVQIELNDAAALFLEALQASDFQQATVFAEKIRKIVSAGDIPPLDELKNCGVVPYFLNILEKEYYQYTDLIQECSWVITNATSGEKKYVEALIELGVVPKFLGLLLHHNENVRDNAIWCLANIAGDSITYRDQMLEMRVSDHLDYLLENQDEYRLPDDFMTQLAWFIATIMRGPSYPDIFHIKPFLKFMRMLILDYEEERTLHYTLDAFAFLAMAGTDHIEEIFNLDVVERMITLAYTKNTAATLKRLLRIFGYMAIETSTQVQRLMDAKVHEVLIIFLDHKHTKVKKEAALALSNFMAADEQQLEEIFTYQDGRVIDRLLYMIENEPFEVSKECTYCLVNACRVGAIHHIQELVKKGIIEMIISTMRENTEVKLLVSCVAALSEIFDEYKNGQSMFETDPEEIAREIYQIKGYEVLEELQKHENVSVYEAVSDLIQNHLEVSEETTVRTVF